jgi:transcriptional regulator with XRE-family HTH domain
MFRHMVQMSHLMLQNPKPSEINASSDATSRREFGKWIRDHRRKLELSGGEAAKRAGFSLTQWMRLERGEAETKRTKIPAIATAAEADLAETYRLAGFGGSESWTPDRRELMYYYDSLPPICKYDMLTLAKQLYDNHVVLGRRAARIAIAAGIGKSQLVEDYRTVLLQLPGNWREDPVLNVLVTRINRVVPESPEESIRHRKRA